MGCPRIGAPVFLWEFCSKVTTEWLFYKCSEWSVAAREMHLSGCWKAAICHRCHLSQMCSAAREEFPHFLEGLQGAMMAASSPPWFEFEFLVSSLALCLCIAQKHLKEPSAVGC